MRTTILVTLAVLPLVAGCAGSGAAGGGAAAGSVAADAPSFNAEGLSVKRPEGWRFVQPDQSVPADTLIVLQGPITGDALAAAVEIGRRKLSAAEMRRKPSHILTALTTEVVQVYAGFETVSGPEDTNIGGQPAARIKLSVNEQLPDGGQEARSADFVGVVVGDHLWLLRCLGPADGSATATFDQILGSVAFEG